MGPFSFITPERAECIVRECLGWLGECRWPDGWLDLELSGFEFGFGPDERRMDSLKAALGCQALEFDGEGRAYIEILDYGCGTCGHGRTLRFPIIVTDDNDAPVCFGGQ